MKTTLDVTNFTSVYNTYNTKVKEVIRMKVNNSMDRDDIHAETFIKVSKYSHTFNPAKGQFSTFIFGIINSCIIDNYRKNKTHNFSRINVSDFVSHDGEEFFTFTENSVNIEKQIDSKGLKEKIRNAFKNMKPTYRTIATLYFINELQYSEIAESLDLPLNTVKVMIMRSRKILRESLKNEYANI